LSVTIFPIGAATYWSWNRSQRRIWSAAAGSAGTSVGPPGARPSRYSMIDVDSGSVMPAVSSTSTGIFARGQTEVSSARESSFPTRRLSNSRSSS
jgi:hypothetical protein